MILRKRTTVQAVRELEQSLIRAAFTLMEMLIVVAIIVALAGMGGYYFLGQLNQSKKKIAQTQVSTTLETAVTSYITDHGQAPQSLEALLQKDDRGGPYLKGVDALTDPWGNRYQYNPSAAHPETGAQQPEIYTSDPTTGQKISNFSHR
jgi:general secretion pathway protein G